MARPSKFTPELGDLICTFIENGMPRRAAARAAGIHPSTLFAWIRRGEDDTDEIDPDDHLLRDLKTMAADRDVDTTGCRTKADYAQAINDHGDPGFSEFSDRIRAADARFMTSALSEMRRVGGDDWRMWLTILERRFPDQWGRRPAGDTEVTDDDFFDQLIDGGASEQQAELMLERTRQIKIKMLGTGTDD